MKSAHKKELARKVYQRIKDLRLPVRMDGPWVTLDAKGVPSDLVVDMAFCDPNELAALVKGEKKL